MQPIREPLACSVTIICMYGFSTHAVHQRAISTFCYHGWYVCGFSNHAVHQRAISMFYNHSWYVYAFTNHSVRQRAISMFYNHSWYVYAFSNHAVHQRAIGVLCNLLYNHDLDVRYTDPQIKVRLILSRRTCCRVSFPP